MKIFRCLVLCCLISATQILYGQSVIKQKKFFEEDTAVSVTLTTDIGKLLSEKMKGSVLDATFTCHLPDTTVSEQISINARGEFRRRECYIPPLRLNFRKKDSSAFSSLNSLKLVCACKPTDYYEQLLLKEYLVYKMYNLLTDRSFRVRLIHITYEDSKGKKKPVTQYAFFVEKIDAMAKRNDCKEWKGGRLNYEVIDRKQMTLMGIFQYMIGNTDWGLSNFHNLKFIYSKKDSTSRPYIIPYDFDYSGIVNADYAVPSPELGIENVTQRLYRGWPRTMSELEPVIAGFKQQKDSLYSLIKNFEPLENRNKKEMINYLDDFYRTINDPVRVKIEFIDNARQR